jgi:hypothetical protein
MKPRWILASLIVLLGALAALVWPKLAGAGASVPFAWADFPGHVSYTLIAFS